MLSEQNYSSGVVFGLGHQSAHKILKLCVFVFVDDIDVVVVHSILRYPTAIYEDILQYIVHVILLTFENLCDTIIA